MIAPLSLILFAALLAAVAAPLLRNASWPSRSPALGIFAWQTLTASIFMSLVLAGLALAVPELPDSEGFAAFVHACAVVLQDHYATPGGVMLSVAGGVLALGLTARFSIVLTRQALRSVRDRARQRDLLCLVCLPHDEPDVVVVEHPAAAVYCLPGRQRQIVVTQGALTALSCVELEQVLAHERAHLRARHDLALLVADAFAETFAYRLGFGLARDQIAELAEMHADDAADSSMRAQLASALIVLAGGGRPAGALGASGGSRAMRVQRLVTPIQPVNRRQSRLVVVTALAGLTVPVVIALAPAFASTLLDYCPVFLD